MYLFTIDLTYFMCHVSATFYCRGVHITIAFRNLLINYGFKWNIHRKIKWNDTLLVQTIGAN